MERSSMELTLENIQTYLQAQTGQPVTIQQMRQLGGATTGREALKQFGYGRPLLIEYQLEGCQKKIVIHQINRNAFGHERAEDRVAAVWFDFNTFNRLPRHVPAVDMVACAADGTMQSLKTAQELFLVTGYRAGQIYAEDFFRIRDQGSLQAGDCRRVATLATYLAQIHQVKHLEPMLWRRRLRDLIGHGEGIMGLTDSYPPNLPYVTETELRQLEELANQWRWRLKPLDHRLRQVHGDFHPFNILFEAGENFHVLDRSRGEWGEPADDVSCLTINYLFFSLQRYGRLAGPFQVLHDHFWEHYLALRPDEELLTVIQPWFAWRALVLASPIWYPTLLEENRRQLLTFARRVMATDRYDYHDPNRYLAEA
jgi:hypothetical protein